MRQTQPQDAKVLAQQKAKAGRAIVEQAWRWSAGFGTQRKPDLSVPWRTADSEEDKTAYAWVIVVARSERDASLEALEYKAYV